MTTAPISTEAPSQAIEAEPSGDSYQTVLNDESIQFAPTTPEPRPEPPSWLADLMQAIADFFKPLGEAFGSSWPVVKWVLIAAAVALALILLWNLLKPVLNLKSKDSEEDDTWIPQQGEAIALLEEADTLAAAGEYDAATHLLLKRSVSQIAGARPDWVDPSSTARELAALPALPSAARTAFGTIAETVERSLFALRKLGADDWQTARDAYAQFALERLTDSSA